MFEDIFKDIMGDIKGKVDDGSNRRESKKVWITSRVWNTGKNENIWRVVSEKELNDSGPDDNAENLDDGWFAW